jgi:hypothetical protein
MIEIAKLGRPEDLDSVGVQIGGIARESQTGFLYAGDLHAIAETTFPGQQFKVKPRLFFAKKLLDTQSGHNPL